MALLGFVWLVSSIKGTEEKAKEGLQVSKQHGHASWAINIHLHTLFNEVSSREDAIIERGVHCWRSWGAPVHLPAAVGGLEWSQLMLGLLGACAIQKSPRGEKEAIGVTLQSSEGMPGCSGQSGKSGKPKRL